MYSIAARRANQRVCQLQPNGMLSRGTQAYPGANGVKASGRAIVEGCKGEDVKRDFKGSEA
jgi:hypothetical protein